MYYKIPKYKNANQHNFILHLWRFRPLKTTCDTVTISCR